MSATRALSRFEGSRCVSRYRALVPDALITAETPLWTASDLGDLPAGDLEAPAWALPARVTNCYMSGLSAAWWWRPSARLRRPASMAQRPRQCSAPRWTAAPQLQSMCAHRRTWVAIVPCAARPVGAVALEYRVWQLELRPRAAPTAALRRVAGAGGSCAACVRWHSRASPARHAAARCPGALTLTLVRTPCWTGNQGQLPRSRHQGPELVAAGRNGQRLLRATRHTAQAACASATVQGGSNDRARHSTRRGRAWRGDTRAAACWSTPTTRRYSHILEPMASWNGGTRAVDERNKLRATILNASQPSTLTYRSRVDAGKDRLLAVAMGGCGARGQPCSPSACAPACARSGAASPGRWTAGGAPGLMPHRGAPFAGCITASCATCPSGIA